MIADIECVYIPIGAGGIMLLGAPGELAPPMGRPVVDKQEEQQIK
jgi:hypothetical protein